MYSTTERVPEFMKLAVTLAFTAALATAPRARADAPPLKIGFVYVSPIGEAGWTYQHNLGRLALEKALDDLVGGFLPRELAEELFDVLDLQRARLERVLFDDVLHLPLHKTATLPESAPRRVRPEAHLSG